MSFPEEIAEIIRLLGWDEQFTDSIKIEVTRPAEYTPPDGDQVLTWNYTKGTPTTRKGIVK